MSNKNLYNELDIFFNESDNIIEFDEKTIPDIIKQVVKVLYKAKNYQAQVKYDADNLLIEIENIYGKKYKHLIETSKKAHDTKTLQYYVNCDDDVVAFRKAYERYMYYYNRLNGIVETLDKFCWQLNNMTKLLVEKLDSFTI